MAVAREKRKIEGRGFGSTVAFFVELRDTCDAYLRRKFDDEWTNAVTDTNLVAIELRPGLCMIYRRASILIRRDRRDKLVYLCTVPCQCRATFLCLLRPHMHIINRGYSIGAEKKKTNVSVNVFSYGSRNRRNYYRRGTGWG